MIKLCFDCKYNGVRFSQYPCNVCEPLDGNDKWEAKEE